MNNVPRPSSGSHAEKGQRRKSPRKGKRRELFTSTEIKRARRGDPSATIRICLGRAVLELVPPGVGQTTANSPDDLDRELKDFQARHGQD